MSDQPVLLHHFAIPMTYLYKVDQPVRMATWLKYKTTFYWQKGWSNGLSDSYLTFLILVWFIWFLSDLSDPCLIYTSFTVFIWSLSDSYLTLKQSEFLITIWPLSGHYLIYLTVAFFILSDSCLTVILQFYLTVILHFSDQIISYWLSE